MKRSLIISAYNTVIPAGNDEWKTNVPAKMKRRDARIWQLAYAAVHPLVNTHSDRPPRSVIVGTALGALEETRCFLEGVYTDGLGSPRNFISSVHNSIAGKIALECGIRGPNLTMCDSHNSLASSIIAADLLTDKDFPVLICCVDERIALLDTLQPHFTRRCRSFLHADWNEAAAAFLVDTADNGATGRPVRAFGPRCTQRRDPEFVCRSIIQKELPVFTGAFLFSESSASFIHPAITAADILDTRPDHTIIGSFSPTSGAVALVELAPAT